MSYGYWVWAARIRITGDAKMVEDFDPSRALKKATGRAKSDVANKIVSMFLHEVSRKACAAGGLSVTDPSYREAVVKTFGARCLYCSCPLERDRISVEHLEGMNRFRAGLHVPGNVAVACRRCNNEKRRDDQKPDLASDSGWMSFVSHHGASCQQGCKTCGYWTTVWSDPTQRASELSFAAQRILAFREKFGKFVAWSDHARPLIRHRIETLYRDCQAFAASEIRKLSDEIKIDFSELQ